MDGSMLYSFQTSALSLGKTDAKPLNSTPTLGRWQMSKNGGDVDGLNQIFSKFLENKV